MTDVSNKTVLVTGGAMGMGKLYAERSVEEGARVVIWDINKEAADKTAEELRNQGGEVHPYVVDISSLKSIQATAKKVLKEVGTIDILFNNAGIVVGAEFVEHTPQQIEKTMQINTIGLMHVTQAFLPGMMENNEGHIINIASAAGLVGNPKMAVYCASKWAVIGFSESLRVEMEKVGYPNIRVLTVTPSYVNTGMFDGAKAPLLTPMLEPDEVVNAVWDAIEKNTATLRAPFIVNAVPLLKSVLPTKIFDFVAGDLLGVYKSMEDFKGRKD